MLWRFQSKGPLSHRPTRATPYVFSCHAERRDWNQVRVATLLARTTDFVTNSCVQVKPCRGEEASSLDLSSGTLQSSPWLILCNLLPQIFRPLTLNLQLSPPSLSFLPSLSPLSLSPLSFSRVGDPRKRDPLMPLPRSVLLLCATV